LTGGLILTRISPADGHTAGAGYPTLLTLHIEWCTQRNLRQSYIDTRRRAVTNYQQWLGHNALSATEGECHRWHSDIAERITPAARAVFLSHVVNYHRWLVTHHHRPDDPTIRLVRPRLQRRLPRPIPDEQLYLALENAPDRVRPWLHLAAYMGLRACEIARLRGEDVRYDLEPPALIVMDGKGGKQRVVPLHPAVARELEGYPTKGWMFPHWNRTGPVKPHNVCHGVNEYMHSLGISATLHQARHWFGTNVYQTSKDLRLTQELMGHASPTTTALYAAWDVDSSAAVVNALQVGDGGTP
jgi:integrase/recombinase XerC